MKRLNLAHLGKEKSMSTFMGGVSKILKYIFNYHCNLDEI